MLQRVGTKARRVRSARCMEFAMRNPVAFAAIGLALMAGTTLAHAQTAETIITPEPGGAAAYRPECSGQNH